MKSVLLYGAPKTGKTSLCQSIAHAAGANFFDLSPRNTDAKYPGKAVALMVHMVGEACVVNHGGCVLGCTAYFIAIVSHDSSIYRCTAALKMHSTAAVDCSINAVWAIASELIC